MISLKGAERRNALRRPGKVFGPDWSHNRPVPLSVVDYATGLEPIGQLMPTITDPAALALVKDRRSIR